MNQQSMKALKNGLQVIPIGGCGDIGMNMTLYQFNNSWLMVDCGIGFTEEGEAPGVDVKVPDLQFLEENNIKISGLVITHAHEDHVGGVCYLLNYLKCPIYATVFVANFIRTRAASLGLDKELNLVEIIPTRPIFTVGSIEVEMVGLTHSVVESQGLYIKAGGSKVFHTGDWKIDPEPVVGEITQKNRLIEIGNEGVDLLVCDSTNVFRQEAGGSEGSMEESLFEVIKDKKNRVVIGVFSSNVARIKTIAEVAKMTNRKLFVAGTSLHRIIGIAAKSGYLSDVEYFDMKDARDAKRKDVLVIATGCQGEPMASVAKLSNNTHPLLRLSSGDCVVLSSKIIPNNSNRILKMVNKLVINGIDVVTEKDSNVHVSGHPSVPELKEMYSMLRPRAALPVHGNPILLKEHCRLAKEVFGVKQAFFVSDGTMMSVKDSVTEEIGKIPVSELGVDGYILRPLESNVMRERRKIQNSGAIFCSAVVDSKGKLLCNPAVSSVGLLDKYEDQEAIKHIAKIIINIISKKTPAGGLQREEKITQKLGEDISQQVLQFARNVTGKSPLVKASVIVT